MEVGMEYEKVEVGKRRSYRGRKGAKEVQNKTGLRNKSKR
jgi:hypothetical protein